MKFIWLERAPIDESLDLEKKIFIKSQPWLKWISLLLAHVNSIAPSVGTDNGDNDIILTWNQSAVTQLFETPITTARTVILSTTGAVNGAHFKIVRTSAATGAFSIDVGGLKNLAVGTWCEVDFTGTEWKLTGAGTL